MTGVQTCALPICHFWMAPCAHDNVRLELSQVKAPLDIYPLGKVLWSMISGRNGFPFWEYNEDANNLEKLFPNDPNMSLINGLLAKCIVRREQDCALSSAHKLRSGVDDVIAQIKTRRGYRSAGADMWPCMLCNRFPLPCMFVTNATIQHCSAHKRDESSLQTFVNCL